MARLLDLGEAIELHCDLVNRYGGQSGIRHTGALRGAVGQRDTGDVYDIAAGYAFDFATSRPFPESNARAGLVAALVFLDLNGVTLGASDDDFVRVVTRIKNRSVGPKKLAKFFRERAGQPAPDSPREAGDSPGYPEPLAESREATEAKAREALGATEEKAESRPGDRPTSSASVTEALSETAGEIEAALDDPSGEPVDMSSPAAAPDPDAPMGPGAGAKKERQTSVRDLADALADFEDEDQES